MVLLFVPVADQLRFIAIFCRDIAKRLNILQGSHLQPYHIVVPVPHFLLQETHFQERGRKAEPNHRQVRAFAGAV
jgi:hypothetical protein